MQQNLSKYYRFERADTLCELLNKFINMLKRDSKKKQKKIPMLEPNDERKYMTDREILEKYIDLEKSCLTDKEKKEVMDMLYKYKGAFSLMDEIGTCPYIEVKINVMDKLPFFINTLPHKKEDKTLIDKEVRHLCYLGIV